MTAQKRRPAGDRAADLTSSDRRPQDIRTALSARDLEILAARTGYVVRVAMTLTNGQAKVQHFASLHAAAKAQERARSRDCDATLTLCRVVPVGPILAPRAADTEAVVTGGC